MKRPLMTAKPVIAIDFDHTIWDTLNNQPLPGAASAIRRLREEGYQVWIHSCNNPSFIEKSLRGADIPFDYIWTGENGAGKPVADLYVDDRGFRFEGDWGTAVPGILEVMRRG